MNRIRRSGTAVALGTTILAAAYAATPAHAEPRPWHVQCDTAQPCGLNKAQIEYYERLQLQRQRQTAIAPPPTSAEWCARAHAALRNLQALTRTVDGHDYRADGMYSAGAALTSALAQNGCAPATAKSQTS